MDNKTKNTDKQKWTGQPVNEQPMGPDMLQNPNGYTLPGLMGGKSGFGQPPQPQQPGNMMNPFQGQGISPLSFMSQLPFGGGKGGMNFGGGNMFGAYPGSLLGGPPVSPYQDALNASNMGAQIWPNPMMPGGPQGPAWNPPQNSGGKGGPQNLLQGMSPLAYMMGW